MGHWDDVVRQRIKAWMAGKNVNRTQLGEAAGYNQPWATRYLEGEHNADLDTLGRIATFLGQPLSALFDQPPDPAEAELLLRFRGLSATRRDLILSMLRDWVPNEPAPRGRARSR